MDMVDERDRVRQELPKFRREEVRRQRDDLICAGAEAGLSITELARLAGLTRQGVYNALRGRLAVHHIDGNPWNNDPANLTIVPLSTNTSHPPRGAE